MTRALSCLIALALFAWVACSSDEHADSEEGLTPRQAWPLPERMAVLVTEEPPTEEDIAQLREELDGEEGAEPLAIGEVGTRSESDAEQLTVRPRAPRVKISRGALTLSIPSRMRDQDVRNGVSKVIVKLRSCFEHSMKRSVSGSKVKVTFIAKVRRNGSIATPRVEIEDSQGIIADGRSLIPCLQKNFAKTRLPPPKGGPVTLHYPMWFAPVL